MEPKTKPFLIKTLDLQILNKIFMERFKDLRFETLNGLCKIQNVHDFHS